MLLPFAEPLTRARFVRREKRFTVVCDQGGKRLLAHTNNTGSMLGLLRPGADAWLSPAANPARKLKWTLELLDFHGTLCGVNTLTPNRLLRAAWEAGAIDELRGFSGFRPEARVGRSRLDARLDGADGALWVECKNVTLVEDEVARFPDAPTERGRKHLEELIRLAGQGAKVALFFAVQRADARCFGPADMIDPDYARLFFAALDAGVLAWPHLVRVTPAGIDPGPRLPITRG